MSRLHKIFLSKIRAQIFRRLFGLSDKPVYLNQLIQETGFVSRSIEQEIKKLKDLDLITADRDGGRVNYFANRSHPLYQDIRNIVLKTDGLTDVLLSALTSFETIIVAFVYGSFAQSSDSGQSDIDVIVIGNVSNRDLAGAIRPAVAQLGREVNVQVFTPEEFSRRLSTREHFVTSVMGTPRQFIIGNEHELERLGSGQVDAPT